MKSYRVGQKVSWKWLGGVIDGKVVEVFYERVEKTIKGKNIVRIGSKQKPAYLVRSEKGNLALKLHSELSAATSSKLAGSSLVRSLTEG